ncbi:hypothetical protein [Asticcacaulis sp. YBE204]|uniref:hypothetical protein n=1 Tax=Asticcacaulis sp. YBE204 TaxID=1282363 RepID=UPI0003C40542|nr:hypothetical protein [Asticcacaulis sp. YBE204]ESQ78238.1 hypothetical protein AEYBE204_15485 [Asticcacaulis sp. YBE204]
MNTPSQFQTIIDKRNRDAGIRDIPEPKTTGIYKAIDIAMVVISFSQALVFASFHDKSLSTEWEYFFESLVAPIFRNIAVFAKADDPPTLFYLTILLISPLLVIVQDRRFPMKVWALVGSICVMAGAMFSSSTSAPYAVVLAFIVWYLGQVIATHFIRLSKTFRIVNNDRVVAGCCLFVALFIIGVGVPDISNYVLPLVAGIFLGIWMWFYKPAEKV